MIIIRESIYIPPAALQGDLIVPNDAPGIVLFAHGSGSSRHSSRNVHVSRLLNDAGLATLLFDLLTPEEEEQDRITCHLRFNIGLLADRLIDATRTIASRFGNLPISYFGASTGAAAALVAAVTFPDIAAIVSRGGRPDLAGAALPRVHSPTLLIVGGNDHPVIPLNESAFGQLRCERRIAIVPGASHLFEERGTLDHAAGLARDWFVAHMPVLTR